jgi:hypothetical protein
VTSYVAALVVSAGEIYLVCGALFALPFVVRWVGWLDPGAREGTWGFRILIVPGVMLFWPLLAARLALRWDSPPEEWTAHRHPRRLQSRPNVRPIGDRRPEQPDSPARGTA